jgi:hypothetical protein
MTVINLLKRFAARKAEMNLTKSLMALHEKLLITRAAAEYSYSKDLNAFSNC